RLQSVQQCWVMRLLEWLLLSGFIYHVIAGIRHLCMDAGYFEGKENGKFSAVIVALVSLVLILAVGGWFV
ncbi:MAG: succinate dehydrogenase, cytochrome b556 subunit, partial [Gammaproteobacteria bacterium]|nr:succinate dehydrogenase, cytochrome b556 subunit [Gammaproteobacteria bacterium]